MSHITLDLETRSAVDLRKTGVSVYARDRSTDVWCAAYAVDDEPVQLWLPGEPCPPAIVSAVAAGWPFHSHNASFERTLWTHVLGPRYGWPEIPLEAWRCSMAAALALSLPASLQHLGPALGLDVTKDMEGKRLMLTMARPRKARKKELLPPDANGHYWFDDAARRQRLYDYCKQDVETERAAEKRLLPLSPSEQFLWRLDQRINDRGVFVDHPLAQAALKIVQEATADLNRELRDLTGREVLTGTNVEQMKAWLAKHGHAVEALDKEQVNELLAKDTLEPAVRRVLEIRREVSKASVKKINALLAGRDEDGRARGLLQFHAASTGRWGGRRFQPQNIKRPTLKDVDTAIRLLELADIDAIRLAYDDPLSVVADTLRALLRAAAGRVLFAADFSNIEGRGLAWLAGEQWKLDAFRAFDQKRGPDIYKLSYSRAFELAIEYVDDAMRQMGKVMELALGYEGGVGAFQTMAANYGVKVADTKADELKVAWREAHPETRQLWRDLNDEAVRAVSKPGTIVSLAGEKIAFLKRGSFLFMRLPSGRTLAYSNAELVEMVWVEHKVTHKRYTLTLEKARTGTDIHFVADEAFLAVRYMGVGKKGSGHWGWVYPYGGMWAENAVQALSRDVMAAAMIRLEAAGYPIILTVHDEVVSETDASFGSLDEFQRLMVVPEPWMGDFPVAAAGWRGERYRKA